MNNPAPTIALIAGEASGDQLGAALVNELKEIYPDARFVGIAGRQMKAAGVETWWDCSELAVFGLFEVLSHFPRLLKLRRELVRRLLGLRPDVVIGIDAPDFNLGLEIRMRREGIRTVQYVSPTVWAWREKRVRKIARAADLMLCLFPFEPEFFRHHAISATYVGHPLADQVEENNDPRGARQRIDLIPDATTVSLLPGSRLGEVSRLAEPMIGAARILSDRHPGIQFACAIANQQIEAVFRDEMERLDAPAIRLVQQDPRSVIAAADTVLCASGTATLEVMLVNRPLVMTYRVAPSTYRLGKALNLVKLKWFSLPNILADEGLVPELIQNEATAENLADAADRWLNDDAARERLFARFRSLHETLQCDAGRKAAQAVAGLLGNTAA
jgi:lipid-A-disaccharide synthase